VKARQWVSQPAFWAAILSLSAVLSAYAVSVRIFEQIPHLEDELAYLWQARVYADGRLTIPSPEQPRSFLVPFVVDYQGQRFSKYPPGWSAVLAVGVALGVHEWVNPLLAGLGVWLSYRLGARLFGQGVGLLAALLTVTSPFFLMNSGSLLSHPLGLVLSAAFALGWLEALDRTDSDPAHTNAAHPNAAHPNAAHPRRAWLAALVSGVSLGLLALTRPLTAVGLAIPFGLHGLWLLVGGNRRGVPHGIPHGIPPARWQVLKIPLTVGASALAIALLLPAWQYAVTGDPLLNPYVLWWPYDTIGFGPGVGVKANGHTLAQAWYNTQVNLSAGAFDLFGWGPLSAIFLPLGIVALAWLPGRRRLAAGLVGAMSLTLIVAYMAYWIGAQLYGPRYYYEALPSLTIFTAAGVAWLAGKLPGMPGPTKVRAMAVTGLLTALVALNLFAYLPVRLQAMVGLYGIHADALEPFRTPEAQALTPALVIVHSQRWMPYGGLLELQDPLLSTPFIFAWSHEDASDQAAAALYPNRTLIHYYPEQPGIFYLEPKTKQESNAPEKQ